MIGGFVLGAIALLVSGTLIFGGSELLKEKSYFVSYFDGSVKGLRVGSSVLFRGVRVGYVTDIRLIASIETLEAKIPVIYEIDPSKFSLVRNDRIVTGANFEREAPEISEWIEAGLRAQLDSESFVTGQLVIELDFLPDTPAEFRNEALDYTEIPSVTSGIAQIIEDAQRFVAELQSEIDVKELSEKLNSILDGVDEIANSQELRSTLAGIDTLVNSSDTQNITAEMKETLDNLDRAITDMRGLIATADTNLQPIAAGLANTLTEAEQLLRTARTQLDGESALAVQLGESLEEITEAARAVRILADYLERHPEALIRGKK